MPVLQGNSLAVGSQLAHLVQLVTRRRWHLCSARRILRGNHHHYLAVAPARSHHYTPVHNPLWCHQGNPADSQAANQLDNQAGSRPVSLAVNRRINPVRFRRNNHRPNQVLRLLISP